LIDIVVRINPSYKVLASLLQLAANKIGISKASIGVTIFSLILVVLANKLAKPTYYSLQTIF